MSIALVVTAGFGNGTLSGSITDVVLRGYSIGEAPIVDFDVTFGVEAIINDSGLGLIASISTTGQGVLGSISDTTGVQAIIDEIGVGVLGDIDDTGQGVIGKIK